MKLVQIVNAQPAIKVLVETKLPVKTSFRLAKVLKMVADDLQLYEDTRIKLLAEFGVLKEDKSEYIFETPEKESSFLAALKEIQNEEIDLAIHTVSVEDLGDIAIEPGVLFPLIGILLKE